MLLSTISPGALMSPVTALREWLNENESLMMTHGVEIRVQASVEAKSLSVSLELGAIGAIYSAWDRSPSGIDLLVGNFKTKKALLVLERTDPALEVIIADLREMSAKLLGGEYERMDPDKTTFIRT